MVLLSHIKTEALEGEVHLKDIKFMSEGTFKAMFTNVADGWVGKVEHYLHNAHVSGEIIAEVMHHMKDLPKMGDKFMHLMHNPAMQALGVTTSIIDMVKCAEKINECMS